MRKIKLNWETKKANIIACMYCFKRCDPSQNP